MPTLWSKTLIPTARQVPAEAEVPSHQLMLRAGLIRKLGAGVYDYLPMGVRSLRKAMQIIHEEMANAGALEVMLPALIPIELYQTTGRDQAYGDNLFRVTDRHGRVNALAPTHEEIITEIVGAYIESYKQLPITLYQIQTKFRDEFRPRFGVLRSREFQMKDAYSFHTTLEGPGGLNEVYQTQYDAYCRVFTRAGIPFVTVEAESGPIGGSASHEFMVPSPTGEDTILESDKFNYAANVEKCEIGARAHDLNGAATGEMTKVHTPNVPGIEDVAKFMKCKAVNMLKTLVFQSTTDPASLGAGEKHPTFRLTIAVVRGDHDVNEGKIKAAIKSLHPTDTDVQLADEKLARAAGFSIGYVGPHSILHADQKDVTVFVDPDAAKGGFWVTGANEADHHVKHFNWKRDVLDLLGDGAAARVVVADIRNAVAGDLSPKGDGGVLRTRKGIEIGHVFKLGTKYTDAMKVTVLNEKNERQAIIMGCYGIGVNRILAGAIERDGGHDENGIIWPVSIAPFAVAITPIKYEGALKETALKIAAELEALGSVTKTHAGNVAGLSTTQIPVDVLIDDRDERPGVKFKDADLIGIPVRVTIGDKALANGQVEIKARKEAKAELVAVADAAKRVREMIASM
jgi:prolyl-tRNA synthetase